MRNSLIKTTGWLGIILLCTCLQPVLLSDAVAWDDRLTSAVQYDDLDLARHLLEDGFAIDVNDCNNKRHTPLSLAIRSHNAEMVRLLLEHDARSDIGPCFGHALFVAIEADDPEIVSLLVEYGADVNLCCIDQSRNYRRWDTLVRPFYPGQVCGNCINLLQLYIIDKPGTYTVSIQYKSMNERREPDLVVSHPFEFEVMP